MNRISSSGWAGRILRGLIIVILLHSGVNSVQALPLSPDVIATIDTTADVVADDGLCSLREAINSLVTPQPGNDCPANITVIELDNRTYTLQIPINLEDDPASGDLDVQRAVTIRGEGMAATVIDGNRLDRIFETSAVVRMENLTLQNGSVDWQNDYSREDGGGAIYNRGTLTVDTVRFADNIADYPEAQFGGAIDNTDHLTVINCEFIENGSYGAGGAILSSGYLSIEGSQFIDNHSFGDSIIDSGGELYIRNSSFSGGYTSLGTFYLSHSGTGTIENTLFDCMGAGVESGGALWTRGDLTLDHVTVQNCGTYEYAGGLNHMDGNLRILRSTFANNWGVQGGAVLLSGGSLQIEESLFYGNQAGQGAALYVEGGSAVLVNSTLVDNESDQGAVYVAGGGVELDSVTISRNAGSGLIAAGGVATIHNSILSGNLWQGSVQSGSECQGVSGAVQSLGFNLVGHTSGCAWSNHSGDDVGSLAAPLDPKLGILEDNGGPTWTVELLAGSPAVDDGDNANCPAIDQRGMTRPKDGSGDGHASCDKGAYEVQRSLALPSLTPTQTRTPTPTWTHTPTMTRTAAVSPGNTDTPTVGITQTSVSDTAVPTQSGTPPVVEPTQAALPPVIYIPMVGK